MKVTLAALAGLAAASKHRPRVGVGPLRGTSGFESRLAAADAGLATNGTRPPPAEWVIRGPPGPHQLEHAPGPPMLGTTKSAHARRRLLEDYMALLRLRSLLARGRARHGPETTVVAARLFGSLNGFADVPNECFWRYVWLGDWRHP